MSQTGDDTSPDRHDIADARNLLSVSGGEGTSRKRKHQEDIEGAQKSSSRRKIACQQCRGRKVKCDNVRPICGFCTSTRRHCVYVDLSDDGPKLDPGMAKILNRLDEILNRVNVISSPTQPQAPNLHRTLSETVLDPSVSIDSVDISSKFPHVNRADEMSKDYLRIPSANTTADTVLTWPIFQGRFPSEHLTNALFTSSNHDRDDDIGNDAFTFQGGFEPLSDERIPSLIDRFLENVHTKNPVLDVDALIRYGRRAAVEGPGWDSASCLVLLACALGSLSLPFESSVADRVGTNPFMSGATSLTVYKRELRQAESCYSLACRRLGLLKHTVLGAQCYFYSAVYLMYTFHPLEAWNHFCQASTFYQIQYRKVAKSAHLNLDSNIGRARVTQRRLEQSLYWSCFKSECEMRVELPLPQSSIADVEYPHLFPSPPSHPIDESSTDHYETLRFEQGLRDYSNKVLNEEKSWYYYLTEVALRRIGNRILNTFYNNNHTSWLNISPLIPIAKEFEAQILVWSANLPPSMQYDDCVMEHLSPSQELSWATWNRLLEMRFWLFQPFLYYAIHSDDLHQPPELRSLVDAAMECNAETVRNRTLRHRHHGIWFDIRAIVTAALSVIAAAKSGKVEVPPEWDDRIKQVIAALAFWEGEAPDLLKSRQVLEELFAETRGLIRTSSR